MKKRNKLKTSAGYRGKTGKLDWICPEGNRILTMVCVGTVEGEKIRYGKQKTETPEGRAAWGNICA